MRKFYNIVEDNKAPNVQSLWLHNGSLSYFGNNGWETVGDAASLEELGNKVDSLDKEIANIHDTLENIPSGGSYTEITWQELKNLRDNSQLSAGSLYRIIDYQCTTINPYTTSANHKFDVVVLALANNTLSEQAWADLHEGDTYFANNDLSAWKLWYCLDNDTTRFDWADNTSGNGRGVIYRMIDEFNNDVPYDFKNIVFYREFSTMYGEHTWHKIVKIVSSRTALCYTFNTYLNSVSDICLDLSLDKNNKVFSNIISKATNTNNGIQQLNNSCFFGTSIFNNTFIGGNYNNTFDGRTTNNSFGGQCYDNSVRSSSGNIIGQNFHGNVISGDFEDNIIGNYFYENDINSYFTKNIAGNWVSYNDFGSNVSGNTFGNKIYRCWFSNRFQFNTVENGCQYIRCAPTKDSLSLYYSYQNNYFGSGCCYILFKGEGGNVETDYVQNYNFKSGLSGSDKNYIVIEGIRGLSYETKIGLNSNGELKQWCEANLVG